MSSELITEDKIISDDDVSVPDWHLAILEERMARYQSEPVEWTSLEEFEKELEQFINSLEHKKD